VRRAPHDDEERQRSKSRHDHQPSRISAQGVMQQ
jgi:hypothetical protein